MYMMKVFLIMQIQEVVVLTQNISVPVRNLVHLIVSVWKDTTNKDEGHTNWDRIYDLIIHKQQSLELVMSSQLSMVASH